MDQIKLGYYFRVKDYLGNEIRDLITSFRYKYSEEEDDECTIEIESDDRYLADRAEFREGKKLTAIWGWFNGSVSKQRTVYVFNRTKKYAENAKVTLTLICHEKAAINKMDTVSNKTLTQLQSGASIIFSSNAISNINVELEKGNTELAKFLSTNQLLKSSGKTDEGYIFNTYNGNMSTYYTLRNFLDRLPGGPYVMDSRDDRLLIKTRDFKATSRKTFTWKGGTGELLDFTPMTKNRSRKSSSEQVNVSTYDPKTKTATNISATGTDKPKEKLAATNSMNIINLKRLSPERLLSGPERLKSSDLPFSVDDIYAKQKIKNSESTDPNIKGLVSRIEKAKNTPLTNPYNDFNKKTVDKTLIVQSGSINGTKINKIFLGFDNGKTKGDSFTPGRDNTAVARNNFALVYNQTKVSKNQLSNDPPEKAKALAENTRADNELENNPASAELLGQPEIETGQIITIEGVAKEDRGNYYISECEHILNDSTYKLELSKLVRDGVHRGNTSKKKTKKGSKIKLEDLIPNNPNLTRTPTVTINDSKGPEDSNTQNRIKIKVKKPGRA